MAKLNLDQVDPISDGDYAEPTDPATINNIIEYVGSRSDNLITNGSGLMGDTYNFDGMTFVNSDMPVGVSGSFEYLGKYGLFLSGETIPINPALVYRLGASIKQVVKDGTNPRQYVGLAFLDVDGHSIKAQYHMYHGTTVELTRDFEPGTDSTIYVDQDPGWDLDKSADYQRGIITWDYESATGYVFGPNTYSRQWIRGLFDRTATSPFSFNGTDWEATVNTSGFIANTLLSTVVAGTKLNRTNSGGTYKYVAAGGVTPTVGEWTDYEGFIGGVDTSGANRTKNFPPGSVACKILTLANSSSATSAVTDQVRFAAYHMALDTSFNLVSAASGEGVYYKGYKPIATSGSVTSTQLV